MKTIFFLPSGQIATPLSEGAFSAVVDDDFNMLHPRELRPGEILQTVRQRRTELLTKTDYRILPDYPQTAEVRAAWVTYRQALRDFPTTPNLSLQTPWPTPPAA